MHWLIFILFLPQILIVYIVSKLNSEDQVTLHCLPMSMSNKKVVRLKVRFDLDWLQSLKQFFINVSYHILVASLTLVALS